MRQARSIAPDGGEGIARLPTKQLARELEGWILDGEMQSLSAATLTNRRVAVGGLVAFLAKQGAATVGPNEIRAFLAHLAGHGGQQVEETPKRRGRPRQSGPRKPSTVHWYFNVLGGFFRFLVEEEVLESSPMERLKRPVVRPDQVQPFTPAEVTALLEASRKGQNRIRDPALLLVLLDTGLRAGELCALTLGNLDMTQRRLTVRHGKGGKMRQVYFGARTARALWTLLGMAGYGDDPDIPLFQTTRGERIGEAMTRHALLCLIRDIGKRGGVRGANVHRFRHSFACEFLKQGGNVFSLQNLLGHTSLNVTRRYLAFTQADLQQQHKIAGPVDNLFKRKRR